MIWSLTFTSTLEMFHLLLKSYSILTLLFLLERKPYIWISVIGENSVKGNMIALIFSNIVHLTRTMHCYMQETRFQPQTPRILKKWILTTGLFDQKIHKRMFTYLVINGSISILPSFNLIFYIFDIQFVSLKG